MQLLSADGIAPALTARVEHDFEKILERHFGQFLAQYPRNSCSAFLAARDPQRETVDLQESSLPRLTTPAEPLVFTTKFVQLDSYINDRSACKFIPGNQQ